MVFSLFRKKSSGKKPDSLVDSSTGIAVADTLRSASGDPTMASTALSDRELARLTAEKIDQIESEMISDALADGVSELESKARHSHAGASHAKKPDAVALLKGVAMKEARREFGIEDDVFEGMDVVELADNELPSLDFTPGVAQAPEAPGAVPVQAAAAAPMVAKPPSASAHGLSFGPTQVMTSSPGDTLSRDTTLSGQDPLAIDVIDGAMPDVLEEAAILFSNGNFDAAHEALQRALEGDAQPGHRMLAWHMQFDLLRVKGDREAFDRAAISYANETESSPPAWSDDLKAPVERARRASSPSSAVLRASLRADAASQVDQLLRAAVHQRECRIDFTEVREIDEDGAAQMLRLIAGFSKSGHPLVMVGLDRLMAAVTQQTEVGRDTDPEIFWQLALMSLRVQGEQAAFDDLSIDYCVTYEVSPPPWEPLPGHFIVQASDVPFGDTVEAELPVVNARLAGESHPDRIIVTKDLMGKIADEIALIQQLATKHDAITIDCLLLRRLDFTAAGVLLNQLIQMQGRGKHVHFLQPNYMVYALMLVMGMQELAQIRRRRV